MKRELLQTAVIIKISTARKYLESLERIYKILQDKSISDNEVEKIVKNEIEKSMEVFMLDMEFNKTIKKGTKE